MTDQSSDRDWPALRELAMSMAAHAGELALIQRQSALATVETKASTVDLVTAADKAAEGAIADILNAERPHDAVIGEEGTDRSGSTGLTWFLDPIDGTTNFFYGLNGWVVSVAVGDDDGIGAAAVYDPVANDMFSAHRDGGATLNGQSLACRESTASLASALVGTGFSYQAAERREQAELLTELLPQVRDIRRLGAAARDLCMVALGAYDAYYEAGTSPWDRAAGALIATEAGARVEFVTEGERGILLAAAPQLFDELASLLR